MTLLVTYPTDPGGDLLLQTEDPDRIGAVLGAGGVRFERWPLPELPADPADADILAAHDADVRRLVAEGGYGAVEVVRMEPAEDDPQWRDRTHESREKYLNEHVHDDDEVWFFVRGRACFYLHVGETVQVVVCGPGDLLAIPVRTRHWFDMGPRPDFWAVRFYEEPSEEWVGEFTGDPIAARFPRLLDELAEPRR